MSDSELSDIRREYLVTTLDDEKLSSNPFKQFANWMEEVIEVDAKDATSMVLATANEQGVPSARIVLLKGYDETGFTWFTNYLSEKGEQLSSNPQAELLFYWPSLERQIRIRGRVSKTSREESVSYFEQRPWGSRLSAAASQQSQVVDARDTLERKVAALEALGEVRCPEHWGGYRLVPERFEFWQGRANRLHDRFEFLKSENSWLISRLQP